MRRINVMLLAAMLVAAVLAISTAAGAQETLPPCIGGCDASYPTTYNPYEMWAAYGYPTYSGGCWWYDVGDEWWYMCPNGTGEPNSLYVYGG